MTSNWKRNLGCGAVKVMMGVGVKVKIIMQQARAFHQFAPRISCKFSLVCIWGLIGSRETFGGKARPPGPISRLPTYTAPTLLYTSSVDRAELLLLKSFIYT